MHRTTTSRLVILLTDDDAQVVAAVARALRAAGHTVLVAHDADSAIAAGRAEHIDCVITDGSMPCAGDWRRVLDGLDDVPAVVYSGSADVIAELKRAPRCGVRAVAKPSPVATLLAAVLEVIAEVAADLAANSAEPKPLDAEYERGRSLHWQEVEAECRREQRAERDGGAL